MERLNNYSSDQPERVDFAPLRVEGSVALPRDVPELEEALVRLHALERRIPGNGRWPFAGDGPWHLIQGEVGDYAGDGQDGVSSSAAPRPPLDAAEVAEYERLKRWLLQAPADRRRLLWEATAMLARGEPRPEWGELKRQLGYARTPRRLAQVYREAMAEVVGKLNHWPRTRWRRLAT